MIRKKTYARIWYMNQMRASKAVVFVFSESVLKNLNVFEVMKWLFFIDFDDILQASCRICA
jgi:hypothetical protein